ncbi:hypothetical protein [Rhodococcus sp. IEGM 1408]|uniref:hypothetical protein n=1 Tax=Rhodococcus sp. IEGM 1408 TaxID=3082220 RepID=UPI0029541815|nr:hypothetical protein [Rhodococcus sp. IEGM 1408]MDV8000741.1 hypothetical protein [Rhodococcus sp. IEGM 1408]
MNRRQAYVLLSLLAVVAVVLAVLLGYLLGSGADREADTATNPTTSSSSAPTSASTTSLTVSEDPPTSDAQPAEPPATVELPVPPVETVRAQPTFVRCVTGLASMGIYSDGSTRPDNRCPEPRSSRAEGVCGGLHGWQEVTREEYIDLCGTVPPTG